MIVFVWTFLLFTENASLSDKIICLRVPFRHAELFRHMATCKIAAPWPYAHEIFVALLTCYYKAFRYFWVQMNQQKCLIFIIYV